MEIEMIAKAIRKKARELDPRDEDEYADCIAMVIDEYVAGLSYIQVHRLLEQISPDEISEILEEYGIRTLDDYDFEMFIREALSFYLDRKANEVAVSDKENVPEITFGESKYQVYITTEFDAIQAIKDYVGEQPTIYDLGNYMKLRTGKFSLIVIEFKGQKGEKRRYRIYTQRAPRGIDVRDYFKELYDHVTDNLDPRAYIDGIPKRHYTEDERLLFVDAVMKLNEAMVMNGDSPPESTEQQP